MCSHLASFHTVLDARVDDALVNDVAQMLEAARRCARSDAGAGP